MKQKILLSVVTFLLIAFCYVLLIIYPAPLFGFEYQYQNFKIYSDQEIPSEIEQVLDKVSLNLEKSELYNSEYELKIFFCNNNALFRFLTRNKNAGGVVQGVLSPNVFIRESNISNDMIIPPESWMYDVNDRPLSYFLAHELTHSLQAKYDRFLILKVPPYIMEGYADYIGKGGDFNYKEHKQMLLENHPKMQDSSPLYSKYHLCIAYLMQKEQLSYLDILKQKPEMELVLEKIRTDQ